jgi:F-type H+-transporting ATPase subunit b
MAQDMSQETTAHTEMAHAGEHVEAKFLGLGAEGWVYFSVTAFFALVIWKKGHKMILDALDSRIQKVKDQLAEATTLRNEAEAMKADAVRKKADAETTAQNIVAQAKTDAATLIKDAAIQAETMVARRTKMAEDKIAAAERSAMDDVRTTAANIATAAARNLLDSNLDAPAKDRLVDQAISDLDRRLH